MSSFKSLGEYDDDDVNHLPNKIEDNDKDVIILHEKDTITVKGTKYRRARFDSQDWIYHWIMQMNAFKKIYFKHEWYGEVKKCVNCPMRCIDSK
jgi:hypothetical protein